MGGNYAESLKPCLRTEADDRSQWPHKEPMFKGQADAIVEWIINEILRMADLQGGRIIQLATLHFDKPHHRKTLKVDEPLLVPYVGYQSGHDEWNE